MFRVHVSFYVFFFSGAETSFPQEGLIKAFGICIVLVKYNIKLS